MVSGCNPIVEYTNFHERVFQILRDQIPSLKLTAKAPENGWLEYDRFLLRPGPFSDASGYVSFREGIHSIISKDWHLWLTFQWILSTPPPAACPLKDFSKDICLKPAVFVVILLQSVFFAAARSIVISRVCYPPRVGSHHLQRCPRVAWEGFLLHIPKVWSYDSTFFITRSVWSFFVLETGRPNMRWSLKMGCAAKGNTRWRDREEIRFSDLIKLYIYEGHIHIIMRLDATWNLLHTHRIHVWYIYLDLP